MTGSPRHSVSVAGVVVDAAGRVLLVMRRDNGLLQAPGGVLELDEGFADGVRREVLEETGVVVEVGRLTGVYKNVVAGVVALVYRCSPVSGEAVATDESSETRWVDPAEAMDLMVPAFAVRVADALSDDPVVASRCHDGTEVLWDG